ncbi:MAG: TRAP transporter large permease [Bacillota bacterium]|nr:TRAP transporter large permease [Bacillota bacterium]
MEGILLVVLLVVFIAIGVPIGISIGVATTVALAVNGYPLIVMSQKAFSGVDSFTFLAIPFFMLAGLLMSTGGIARRLIDFANTCIGFITGGLAMTTTAACMFFAAISGSAVATTSAVGSIMIPEMRRYGYDNSFSSSLSACAGTIGLIIPPSIPMVVYAVMAQQSVGKIFIAGIVPGILFGIFLMIACYIMAKHYNYTGTGVKPTLKAVALSFIHSFWALLAPIIILGGIYSGIFTPTEASAVSVVYAFVIGRFVYKELTWKKVYDCLANSVSVNGAVCYLIALSMAFAYFLSVNQIPQQVAGFLLGITDNYILLFLLINLMLLFIGCLMDSLPALIILTPILLPLATSMGMSPITFGVMIVANLAIGMATPPFGPSLFVAATIGNVTLDSMIKPTVCFVAAMVGALMLITYWPWLTLMFM